MRRLILLFATVAALVPVTAVAVFPIALLPGIALVFESGTLAASYATAIALIGGTLAWLYIQPGTPAAGQAIVPKVEVKLKSSEAASMAPTVTFDSDAGLQWPADTVPANGNRTYASVLAYNNSELESRSIQRCVVAGGCNVIHGTYLRNERVWLHESADRYLLFTYLNAAYKVDPHGAALRDGVTASEWGGCPAGYYNYNPTTKTCSSPSMDDGVRLPSDGICSYVTSSSQLVIDPSVKFENYLLDPDCYGKPAATKKLEIDDTNKKTTVEMVSSSAIKVTEEVLDTTTNKTLRTEYIVEGGADQRKLTGGTFNNTFDTDPGTGSGGDDGGSTGSGGTSCGGSGQSPCKVDVDDSGFSGKGDHSTDVATIGTALDERRSTLESIADADIGVSSDWMPNLMPGARLSCTALVYEPAISHGPAAGLGGRFELDICDKLAVVREIIGWIVGIFTAIYIFRVFFRSNTGH